MKRMFVDLTWAHLLLAKSFYKNHLERKSNFQFESCTYDDYDYDYSSDEE